jgi:RecA-family ATPase
MVTMASNVREFPGAPILGQRLDQVQRKRIQWRSRGRVARGKLTVLDGDPGLGKSTLLMDWSAKVSRGLPLPDGDPQHERGVLLICAEDDAADTIVPRLTVMGADLKQITLFWEVPDVSKDAPAESTRLVSLPDDVPLIEDFIKRNAIGLVIVDPLFAFLSPELKANSDQDIRQALTPLAKCLERTGASGILVRHLNKGAAANSLYRGGGSIGIIGIARFGLLVARDRTDPSLRVLASTKTNLGPPPKSLTYKLVSVDDEDVAKVEWLGETEQSADDLLMDSQQSEQQRDQLDQSEDLILKLVANAPVSKQSLYAAARQNNLARRPIEQAIERLKKSHGLRVTKVGGTADTDAIWLWHLPHVNPHAFAGNDPWNMGGEVGGVGEVA